MTDFNNFTLYTLRKILVANGLEVPTSKRDIINNLKTAKIDPSNPYPILTNTSENTKEKAENVETVEKAENVEKVKKVKKEEKVEKADTVPDIDNTDTPNEKTHTGRLFPDFDRNIRDKTIMVIISKQQVVGIYTTIKSLKLTFRGSEYDILQNGGEVNGYRLVRVPINICLL